MAQPAGTVKAEFSAGYHRGDSAPFTLLAVAGSGYQFSGWTGLPAGVWDKGNPVRFTPEAGYTYIANFRPSIEGRG